MARLKITTRNAQSMLEYLVIATVIIAALVAIKPALEAAVGKLFAGSQEQINRSGDRMWELRLQ